MHIQPGDTRDIAPVEKGANYRATHKASVLGILGSASPRVISKGHRFYNKDRWTLRFLVDIMCSWAKAHPKCTPTKVDVSKWIVQANAKQIAPRDREIVIANTPDVLPQRVAMALVGGAYHEALHTKYSCKRNLEPNELTKDILARWAKVKDWSKYVQALLEWTNIIEDIRIERRGREEYEGIDTKMHDLQDYILFQEEESQTNLRGHGGKPGALSVLTGAFRDFGLGYNTEKQRIAIERYRKDNLKAVNIVLDGPLTPFLDESIDLTIADDTGCLRLAMDVISTLAELSNSNEDEQQGDDGDPGDGKTVCPACGADGSKLKVRPVSDGHGGQVKGKGTVTCTVCGWQEEIDMKPKKKQPPKPPPPDSKDPDNSGVPDIDGFDDDDLDPSDPEPQQGKGDKGKGGSGSKADKSDPDEGSGTGKKEPGKKEPGKKEPGKKEPGKKEPGNENGDKPGDDKSKGNDPGKDSSGEGSEGVEGSEGEGEGEGKDGDKEGEGEGEGEGKDGEGEGKGEGESGSDADGKGTTGDGPSGDGGGHDDNEYPEGHDPANAQDDSHELKDGYGGKSAGGHMDTSGEVDNDWSSLADDALAQAENGEGTGLKDAGTALEEGVNAATDKEDDVEVGEAPWRPYDTSMDQALVVPPSAKGIEGDKTAADIIIKSVKAEIAYLRSRLRTMIRSIEMTGTSRGVEKGKRLSSRYLVDTKSALVCGMKPRRAFDRRGETVDMTMACAVVLDESGSMSSLRKDATRIMVALVEPLDAMNCPTLALGFRNGAHGFAIPSGEEDQYHRSASVDYDIFKGFNEKFRAVRWRFANTKALGGTPMSDGVQYALNALSFRKEAHRFLFVVTDGCPDWGHMEVIKYQVRLAKEAGINVIGVGLGYGAQYVQTTFSDSVWTASMADFPKLLLAKMNEIVDMQATKRGKIVKDTSK